MVADQMVCIVVPTDGIAASDAAALTEQSLDSKRLDDLFRRCGRIHFAAFAWLPPHPDQTEERPSALVLELAVDDGLEHPALVDLLVDLGFETLWPLFGVLCKLDSAAPELVRRDALRALLLTHLQGAVGGFVGARDRSVGQILGEAKLYRAARAELGLGMVVPAVERAPLARRLADWASGNSNFTWAAEPAPRSFWRSARMTALTRPVLALAKLGRGVPLVGMGLVALGLLAFAGLLAAATLLLLAEPLPVSALGSALGSALRSAAVFGPFTDWADWAVRVTLGATVAVVVIAWLAVSGIRAVTVAAFALLGFSMVLILLVLLAACVFGPKAVAGFLQATGVLAGIGVLALTWTAAVWLLVALAFLVALLLVPPTLGLPAVFTSAAVLVAAAAVGLHFLLNCIVALFADAGFGLYSVQLIGVSVLLWLLIAAALAVATRGSRRRFGTTVVSVLVLAVLAAVAWHLVPGWAMDNSADPGQGLFAQIRQHSFAGVAAIDVIAVAVALVFTAIAFALTRIVKLPPFAEQRGAKLLDRPRPYPPHKLAAGHQVHLSLERCEVELVAGRRINHMFSITEIRAPVWWNRLCLRVFLWLVTYVGHTIFVNGKLGNAEGIRFGHWHIVDHGRRLLFCSNFDGPFGGYLDEFISGASEGVNLFWRWTRLQPRAAAMPGHPPVARERDFPPTWLLAFGGCKYEQWFKTYARDSMIPHLYRFEAYRHSAQDVERATRLREALFGPRNAVNDDRIMRTLES